MSMHRRLVCVICFLTFGVSVARSAEVIDADPGKIPAAMVWQVQSKDRLIYLAGEIHGFEDVREADIDFQFGLALYNHAAEVYTEARQDLPLSTPTTERLSSLVGPELWRQIETVVSTNVPLVLGTTERAAAFREKLLQEIDNQSAAMAEANLRYLSYFAHIARTKQRPTVVTGLMTMLWKLDDKKGPDSKIKSLEGIHTTDELWRRDCNTRELAQEMMASALLLFDDSAFWNTDKPHAAQRVFSQKGATGDALMATWLANYPGSQVHLACNVIPRNDIWLEKIRAMLQIAGPPVMISMGAIHLFGDKGLLAQLSKSDGLVIRRIYALQSN